MALCSWRNYVRGGPCSWRATHYVPTACPKAKDLVLEDLPVETAACRSLREKGDPEEVTQLSTAGEN